MFVALAAFSGFVSSVSLALFLIMLWARRWPKAIMEEADLSFSEVTISRRKLWLIKVEYSYLYEGQKHYARSFFLFGGRPFRSEEDARETEIPKYAYVCPVNPRISYLRQDKRTFWTFLGASFCGYIATIFMLLA